MGSVTAECAPSSGAAMSEQLAHRIIPTSVELPCLLRPRTGRTPPSLNPLRGLKPCGFSPPGDGFSALEFLRELEINEPADDVVRALVRVVLGGRRNQVGLVISNIIAPDSKARVVPPFLAGRTDEVVAELHVDPVVIFHLPGFAIGGEVVARGADRRMQIA